MAQYFFDLRDWEPGLNRVNLDLPDDRSAADHARCVAGELVKNREKRVRHWRIEVRNDQGERIFSTPLLAYDRTLDHLAPLVRLLIERLVNRRAALQEAIASARTTQRKSRALVSRSRGRPHLVAERGEAI
jgi:hypothetical protein